jgi:DNA-binding NtrC family response regulator
MLGTFRRWFQKKTLSEFDASLGRERLIQAGRIVVVDDETPLLIEELQGMGFSVDHDKSGGDMRNYDNQIYDVAIVDYYGVGQRLGKGQGLDIVKHIRRVSPRTRVIAHTSRSLTATESEFFTLSHVVLPKDLGLEDSLALIERELKKAFAKEHLLDALLQKLAMSDQAERAKLHEALLKSLEKKDEAGFKKYVVGVAGAAAEKSVEIIIDKLF